MEDDWMAVQVGPVVVGTDFSEASAVALAEGRRLAGLLGTHVEVVHVVDGGGWSESGAEAWLREAGLEAGDLVVRFGSPWVELSRFAGEVAPTLVVVGSHGVSGYQPLNMGSTAARVSLHARFPVVLVSPRVQAVGAVQSVSRMVAGRDGAAGRSRAEPGR